MYFASTASTFYVISDLLEIRVFDLLMCTIQKYIVPESVSWSEIRLAILV